MPVLVDRDTQRAASLTASMPAGAHVVTNVEQLDKWLDNRSDEYVVVLGPDISIADAGVLATKLRRTHPSAGVVLTRATLSSDVFANAMQAGIQAVVAENDAPALKAAVDRFRETWEAVHGPSSTVSGGVGTVITIFSPKGGVGKTTLAVNLGLALSGGGGSRVCVVDLDLAFGDVAITLQLIPEHTIYEASDVADHLDFALLETLLTRHEDSLMVLAAPTQPEAKDRMAPELVRRVLSVLRSHFDFVVVDTAPGFDDAVLQAFDETDECILVATLDVPTIKNMKMAIETMDALDLLKGHRHLVLNRADDEVGLTTANVEALLKMNISISIPTDMAVASATNHGRPIVVAEPDNRVSRSIRNLATVFAGQPASTQKEGRRGLFGRHKKN